jgi:phage shock protein A
MAGFLKRVRRITMAKIGAFLDGAENPEEIFPQLVQEMRQEGQKAIQAEATAVAALKRRQQEYDETKDLIQKWATRAELAVKESDDELARTALLNQVAVEKRLEAHRRAVEVARRAAGQAREAREELHKKIETLELKRDEIISRARAARQQEAVQRVLAGVEAGGGSILDAVARMEDKVAEAEARAGAYTDVAADIAGGDTEMKFRELEKKHSVEDRLAELKRRLAGPATEKPDAELN